jgi:hypothetical protein
MIDLCQRKLKQTKKQVELDFVESSRSYIVNPPMKEIANRKSLLEVRIF